MYGQDPVTAMCPRETRWTSHERACKAIYKGYKQFLDALAVCYNERKESEVLGLFILAVTPEIIATVLMLLEVFNCIRPLIPFLQKGQDSLCLSQAQTVLDLTVLNLKNAVHKKTYFKEEEFNQMYLQATEDVLSPPPSTNLRREPFDFASFQNNTYAKFISAFEDELQKAFEQTHFWKCFSVFEPRGLPENINKIKNYGNEELESLIDHYDNIKQDTFKGNTITQDPDIDAEKTCVEWQGFKHFMYLKRGAHHRKIDIEIQSFKDSESEEKDEALKLRKIFGPHGLLKEMNLDETICSVYPNCYKLFYYLLLLPLSTACLERLFSKMKLIKTRLRNNLSQSTLENLLFIATEAPKDFHDDHYEHFVNELKRLNPKMRIKL